MLKNVPFRTCHLSQSDKYTLWGLSFKSSCDGSGIIIVIRKAGLFVWRAMMPHSSVPKGE